MTLQETIKLRKAKKELYKMLLKKGLDSLTSSEKNLLSILTLDDDIVLLLINGEDLNTEKS